VCASDAPEVAETPKQHAFVERNVQFSKTHIAAFTKQKHHWIEESMTSDQQGSQCTTS